MKKWEWDSGNDVSYDLAAISCDPARRHTATTVRTLVSVTGFRVQIIHFLLIARQDWVTILQGFQDAYEVEADELPRLQTVGTKTDSLQ